MLISPIQTARRLLSFPRQDSAANELQRIKPLLSSSRLLITALSCCFTIPAAAATGVGSAEFNWWNLIIALVVLVFSLASAALPLAACRQWRGGWRVAAVAPLAGLLLWLLLIVIGRTMDPSSHRLWPFEIFAWAMLNMIYMVAVMTTKRTFQKADEKAAEQQPGQNQSLTEDQ